MAKSLRKVVFDKVSMKMYMGDKALTVEEAKKLIGWQSEKDSPKAFGDDFKFKDKEGTKIRLDNCETNRPFRKGLALTYANDILRNKWAFNGETIVFDVRNNCQSGQHRLCGFIMAEQIRKASPKIWADYGSRGVLTIECIVIHGISDEDAVVDTLDIGQKRSLGDVIFRNRRFDEYDENEQKVLANVLGNAVRVVWLCIGGQTVTSAPKLLHSVALDLVEEHPRLLECVEHIFSEDGGADKLIRSSISLGNAAGLMYLMAASKTKTAKYDEDGASALDSSLWEKAETFWKSLAQGGDDIKKGHPIFTLKAFLTGQSASGGYERDEILAAVKLAWVAYIEDKKLAGVADLKPGHVTDKKTGKKVLLMPYMGGLDVKREMPEPPSKPVKEPKAPKAPKAAKGGKGKKAKKNTKTTSYQFAVGDEVHVLPSGIDEDTKKVYEAYVGRVASIKDDGKVMVVPKGTKVECELDPAAGDYVGLEAAPEVVA